MVLQESGSELPWDKPLIALQKQELDERQTQIRNTMQKTGKGGVDGTYENYEVVLRYDPLLENAIRLNELTRRNDILREMW